LTDGSRFRSMLEQKVRTGRTVDMFLTTVLRTGKGNDCLFHFRKDHLPVFEKLLYDHDDKVRMEAPEIFRVFGKRRPEFVGPYVEELQQISETDENRIVRIHCLGAIKATGLN
jgi:hypothetical protein